MKLKFLIFFPILTGFFFLTNNAVKAQETCRLPSFCKVNSSCRHMVQGFPCWDGTGPLFGISQTLTDLVYNSITVDDNGTLGAGNCSGSGECQQSIVFKNPDPNLYKVKGLWWRMHDHEKEASYKLSACYTPLSNENCANWQILQEDGVHTSGENCQEQCSKNTRQSHPPGDQGCPDALPDPKFCQGTENRLSWPCALSFDEHVWSAASCNPTNITAFRLEFFNDDAHIHLADAIWILDGPTCSVEGLKQPDQEPFRSLTVTIKNQLRETIYTTVNQPFSFKNLLGNESYTVSVSQPSTQYSSVGSTACLNSTNCHSPADPSNSAYQSGLSRVLNCPAQGGNFSLNWHFVLPSPTPTPTLTPTLTPTPAPFPACNQNAYIDLPAGTTPTPTPTTGNQAGTVKFKVKLQGVEYDNIAQEGYKTQKVRVIFQIIKKLADGTYQSIPPTTFNNVEIKAIKPASGKITIWEGRVNPAGVAIGSNYVIFIKGTKHLQRKFCVSSPTENAEGGYPYRCLGAGNIRLTSSENILDFSGVLLQGGDLPNQDGIVNAYDVSRILDILKNGESRLETDLAVADIDLNGVVNAKDRSYLIETLEEKYGDEE